MAAGRRPARLPVGVRVALPLLVLGIALLIGGGVFSAKPETQAQRAAAIEADVKCPSCPDLSVAQSDASTSLAVRHEIVQMVGEGHTSGQIEKALVNQYGETILLVPPATGGFAVIWLLPVALGVGAVAGVGVLFVRRSWQFAHLRDDGVASVSPTGSSSDD